MKCVLFVQNSPVVDLNVTLTPYQCEVKSALLLKKLPEELHKWQSPDGDLDLEKMTNDLSTRIPHTVKCMNKLDLLQFLSLQRFDNSFETNDIPLFLASFLWHLETGDGISVYPKQTEYLCFAEQDSRFKMVYRVSEHAK